MGTQCFVKWVGRMLALSAALYAAACTDAGLSELPESAVTATELTPVHFEVSCAPLGTVVGGTRAAEIPPVERPWYDGDALQILAEFEGDKLDNADQYKYQYCCFTYSKAADDWLPAGSGNRLMWPVGAERASFTAYYAAGLKDVLGPGASSGEILLGDIGEQKESDTSPAGDPLYCHVDVDYGKSVHLHFNHLCTHLALDEVRQNIADSYWLYKGAEGVAGAAEEIPNAYRLTYDAEGHALKFEFVCSKQSTTAGNLENVENIGDAHYIIARKRLAQGGHNYVDFYLAPTKKADGETRTDDADYGYAGCKLNYANDHPYLSLTSEEFDNLKAGYHYEISVERSKGIVPEPQTGFPDKPAESLAGVSIPELLAGMANEKDVKDFEGNLVLKSVGEPMPRLLRDVDFHDFNPIDYIKGTGAFATTCETWPDTARGPHKDWRLPLLTKNFDGDYHSFIHVAFPIFFSITNAEIYNLAIRQSNVHLTVEKIQAMHDLQIQGEDISESGRYLADFGILCSYFNGTMSNILLEEIDMTVELDETLSGSGGESRPFTIGCLTARQRTLGMGTTSINNVQLRGDVSLTVKTPEGARTTATQDIYVGVIAGQAGAIISGVTCEDSFLGGSPKSGKCTISVPITGDGTVEAGGIAGREIMEVENVNFNVEVDASGLKVNQCYIGGLFGEIGNESEGRGSLKHGTAMVSVKGGVSVPLAGNTETYAYSYCGGIAGKAFNAIIEDINIAGSVVGGHEVDDILSNAKQMAYATGGGFGYVGYTGGSDNTVKNCSVLTSVTAAEMVPSNPWGNHTGWFVGLSTSTREDFTKNGNSARQSPGVDAFIGMPGTEEPTSHNGGGEELTD